jgi:hypothetical protein
MVKNIVWIALLAAGCAQQAAPPPVALDVVDPWKEYQRAPATVMADGTSCPPNYVVKPDDPNDCTPAPGTVPVGLQQPNGTQQAIEDQTRVLKQMQLEQVRANNDDRDDND